MKRLLRLPEVRRLTGRGTSSIYLGMKNHTFPASVAIGERAVAWDADLIEAWVAKRIAESEGRVPKPVAIPRAAP